MTDYMKAEIATFKRTYPADSGDNEFMKEYDGLDYHENAAAAGRGVLGFLSAVSQ